MTDEKKHGKQETEISLAGIRKNWHWILLLAIVVLGFSLRMYHIDYPVVGYHNWKETHYLTEARNFARDGNWLAPRADFPDVRENGHGIHVDTLPVTSWAAAIGFKIFGEKLWVARMASVLFVMASVVLMYLIMKKLFRREDIALLTALIAAANPLLVFFGRQVQLGNPALFFGMLGIYLYLCWISTGHKDAKLLALASLSTVLSILTQYSFAIIAIPIIALFPYRKALDRKYRESSWKQYAYAAMPAALIALWFMNSQRLIKLYSLTGSAVKADVNYKLGVLFTKDFLIPMKSYLADNYTLIGVAFAAFGFALLAATLANKKDKTAHVFLLSYALGIIPWTLVMGFKLSQHSYHQYPVAPVIIMLIAFCFMVIADTVKNALKIRYANVALLAVLFLLLIYPPVFRYGGGILEAKDRQFDTQFIGLDIAGDYIRTHSQPDERVFYSGGQSYGIIWHADRKGSAGHMNSTTTMFGEDTYNFRWIFVYQWGLSIVQDPEKWGYITNNYSLKQIAFRQTQQGPELLYMLFEKGGSFNETQMNAILQEKQKKNEIAAKEYEFTKGTASVIYFNI